jgi:hypothetical protein
MTSKAMKTSETVTAPTYFTRKIGNTTFVVSVSFSEKATDSLEDKMLKFVANSIQSEEIQKCS